MFKYAKLSRVFWPVTLSARDPETGDITEGKAYVLYELLTRDEMKARERKLAGILSGQAIETKDAKGLQKLVADAEAIDTQTDKELLARVHGWRDFTDSDGQQLAFDRKVLAAMLNDPLLHDPIARGLLDASRGAHAKNSQPGLGGTPGPGLN